MDDGAGDLLDCLEHRSLGVRVDIVQECFLDLLDEVFFEVVPFAENGIKDDVPELVQDRVAQSVLELRHVFHQLMNEVKEKGHALVLTIAVGEEEALGVFEAE